MQSPGIPAPQRATPPATDGGVQVLLNLDVSILDSDTIIVATGEIDLATVTQLSTALGNAVDTGSTRVVVNLDKVGYIDSAGLGALVGAHKRLKARAGALVVRCSEPRVLRLFALTGLTKVLVIEGGPEDPAEPAPLVDSAGG